LQLNIQFKKWRSLLFFQIILFNDNKFFNVKIKT